jgi:hypothetical protein
VPAVKHGVAQLREVAFDEAALEQSETPQRPEGVVVAQRDQCATRALGADRLIAFSADRIAVRISSIAKNITRESTSVGQVVALYVDRGLADLGDRLILDAHGQGSSPVHPGCDADTRHGDRRQQRGNHDAQMRAAICSE